ncbi:MAG: NAD-dependent epimerase/dehydratase family protein [Sphingorhabdus sp.]
MSSVILAGATGLVGGHVAALLAAAGHSLHIVTRRAVVGLSANASEHIAAPDDWPEIIAEVQADIAISCLGTTIKVAGSQEAFRAVDLELVRAFGAAAKQSGARQCISVSSTMANSGASSFYLKTKGKAEDALRALDFARLDIIRPGLLKGDRKEFRIGEKLGVILSPVTDMLLHGRLRRYRSIQAASVAMAIVRLAGDSGSGNHIHENDDIHALAAKLALHN